ncbi:MAG: complex I NDUFA9 subunit family protein [Pseudomonadota bacterium]|nr:complex I NDUFA9 subunit family protein [Pseudomonadota bacterium]HJO36111.1 complex I NDUFA9 subunit family protein [Gammaproteobacteria bacterium]
MNARRTCLFGGTGFIGSHLASALSRRGDSVTIFSRRPERHRELRILPGVRLEALDPGDEAAMVQALAGADCVVNLIGILNERGHDGAGFRAVHVTLARRIAAAAAQAGAGHLLHMSALGANADAASHYLRSKAEGEQAVRAACAGRLPVTCLRPSVVFGPGDSFLSRFAGLLRLTPIFPLPCPEATYAPVYVQDVAAAFCGAAEQPQAHDGQAYELCGPRRYTLQALLEYTAAVSGQRRLIIGLPDRLSRLQADIGEYLPGKPFSRDNYASARAGSVCTVNALPSTFGIRPTALEAVAPAYLGTRNPAARHRYRLRQRSTEHRVRT